MFSTDTLAKMSQNIFAYSFISEHSNNLFYFETHIKKVFFSSSTTKVSLTTTLMSTPLFFFFLQSYNSLRRILTIFLFLPIFGLKQPDFREKSVFFAQWSGGYTQPTPLVVRPLKKSFFMCVFPKRKPLASSFLRKSSFELYTMKILNLDFLRICMFIY